jgi:hypothetical protein
VTVEARGWAEADLEVGSAVGWAEADLEVGSVAVMEAGVTVEADSAVGWAEADLEVGLVAAIVKQSSRLVTCKLVARHHLAACAAQSDRHRTWSQD